MIAGLTLATLLVDDYDDALRWFTERLGLEPRMDNPMGDGYRFVTVGVRGQDVEIVLHRPKGGSDQDDPVQATGGVHGFVFSSDDCHGDVYRLRNRGVAVTQGPEEVPWRVQAVFEYLYGYTHVLVWSRGRTHRSVSSWETDRGGRMANERDIVEEAYRLNGGHTMRQAQPKQPRGHARRPCSSKKLTQPGGQVRFRVRGSRSGVI